MYFTGLLSGEPPDFKRTISQFFPYPVRDVYDQPVIPETLGNVASKQYNQHGVRLPADMLASARRQLVVRDGGRASLPPVPRAEIPSGARGGRAGARLPFVPAEAAILQPESWRDAADPAPRAALISRCCLRY